MKLSLVLPAYNEATIAGESVRAVDVELRCLGIDYEIVVADDGSEDATASVVAALGLSSVRVVRLPHRGKGAALTSGLSQTTGDYIGFLDIDLEIPVRYVRDCLRVLEDGGDVAIGSKVLLAEEARSRPLRRRITTGGFNFLARALFRTGISDHQAGLKLFRRDVLQPVLSSVVNTSWLWDTEVLARLTARDVKIREVPITTRHVRPGHISVLSTSLEMLGDLLALRWRL